MSKHVERRIGRARHRAGREPADTDEHRDRLERRAREAAYPQQHAGVIFRRIAVVSGVVAALGSLVVISMASERPPLSQGTFPRTTLQPAATSSSAPAPTSSAPTTTTAAAKKTTTSPTKPPPAKKPAPPPAERPTCTVRYAIEDQWGTGFRTTLTITNSGGTPISPWSLSWTYSSGQQVRHGWDGQYSQSGNRVTVQGTAWNAAIAPGAAISTGFTGALGGSNPAPTAYTLNGAACALG